MLSYGPLHMGVPVLVDLQHEHFIFRVIKKKDTVFKNFEARSKSHMIIKHLIFELNAFWVWLFEEFEHQFHGIGTLHQVCADTGCNLKDPQGAVDDRDGWRASGKFALSVQIDDDDVSSKRELK